MISMTPQYINRAGGILQAISLKSAETVRGLLEEKNIRPPKKYKIDEIDRLLVHTNPHLDEYLAVLLFRACLPEQKLWELPLEEFTLSSTNNDQLARTIWPSSAVIGIGGPHKGGARASLLYDEHVEEGKQRRENSCTMMMSRRHLAEIPLPLFKVIGEVDHIDANANAHSKHLGNYIKWMHEVEYVFSLGASSRNNIKDSISPMWKQSLVEACLTAFILGISDRKPISDANYWKKPAEDSLDQYSRHSLLRNDPIFRIAFDKVKNFVSNYQTSYLRISQPGGKSIIRRDQHGKPIEQLLVMPYLAALCQDYWGAYLGHIVLAHFWEARIQSQMTFEKVASVLRDTIRDGSREIPSVRTPVGQLSFRHIPAKAQQPNGSFRNPWIIELTLNVGMPNAKAPLLDLINKANDGVGYLILRNPNTNNVVLNKGHNTSYDVWKALFEKLVQLEGNADVKEGENKVAGCWHCTRNANGMMADFMLNGNKAHQYVPHTSLDADSLVELIRSLEE